MGEMGTGGFPQTTKRQATGGGGCGCNERGLGLRTVLYYCFGVNESSWICLFIFRVMREKGTGTGYRLDIVCYGMVHWHYISTTEGYIGLCKSAPTTQHYTVKDLHYSSYSHYSGYGPLRRAVYRTQVLLMNHLRQVRLLRCRLGSALATPTMKASD
jgi:hypothetical protein